MQDLGIGNGQAGPGASTTGTIYGVYDMNGCGYEYLMGVIEYDNQGNSDHNHAIMNGNSNFKGLNSSGIITGTIELPDSKYYNVFKSANIDKFDYISVKIDKACNDGVCYGNAFSEVYGASSSYFGWYNDSSYFPYRDGPWTIRGGSRNYVSKDNGIYRLGRGYGGALDNSSSRAVFTP